jgi:histidinol-phosphate aminotransferase
VLIAIEMLAQAEHDPDAAAVLVTTDGALIDTVAAEVRRLIRSQPRADIIRAALASRGALLRAESMQDATAFVARYAPEHLLVMTRDPRALLPELRNAGTIFLGAPSSVAFGDYLTGANHVLPTAGLARAWSGLSTADFIRWTTYQELTPAAAAALAGATAALARVEGLPAHAMAAQLRITNAGQADGSAAPAGSAAASDSARGDPVRLRAAYQSLELYDPGRLPCAIDLSDNTNLFGPAPAVRRAIAETADDRITRYPSVHANDLRAALARLHGVAPENIATGCGSDDVIDSALRAFCEPNDILACPDPTFGMVPIFGRMNALRTIAVPLREEFELDADALIRTRARITYLCRPNNPTGTQFDRSATERVCRGAAGVVLVDEAYADYAEDDIVSHAVTSDRTLVLRTLSKAYGLAGLRVGYAVGPAHLIAEVEKSRGPYKVNGVAESAALAVLAERAWVEDRIAEVRASRTRLLEAVASRGTTAWASAANFVLMSVPGSAAEWNVRLRERGVAVRPFAALPHAGDCIRVSVGPWPLLERFLEAYDDVLDTMAGHGA